jgi:hypothetical protein
VSVLLRSTQHERVARRSSKLLLLLLLLLNLELGYRWCSHEARP